MRVREGGREGGREDCHYKWLFSKHISLTGSHFQFHKINIARMEAETF